MSGEREHVRAFTRSPLTAHRSLFPMRIAITTGGGDAPGLNAVIRAIVLSAHQRGWQAYGIRRG